MLIRLVLRQPNPNKFINGKIIFKGSVDKSPFGKCPLAKYVLELLFQFPSVSSQIYYTS